MTLAIRKRVGAYGFVGLSLVGFCFILHGNLTPDRLLITDPSKGIGVDYVHDTRGEGSRVHLVQGDFWSFSQDEQVEAVVLILKGPDKVDRELPLHPVPGTQHWVGAIGVARGGKVHDNFTQKEIAIADRYLFTLAIRTSEDRTVVLRPERNWFERLMGLSEEKKFSLTFEGEVSPIWLILHIVLMAAGSLFLVHGVYFSLLILMGIGDPLPKLKASLLWGWICFTAYAVPVSIIVSGQALNAGFEPWPVGEDMTNTKSLFLVLLWLGGWIALRKTGERTWAWGTVAAAIVSMAVYLIPIP